MLERKAFEVLPCRTLAGDDHGHVGVTIGDMRESLNQEIESLLLDETPDPQEPPRR